MHQRNGADANGRKVAWRSPCRESCGIVSSSSSTASKMQRKWTENGAMAVRVEERMRRFYSSQVDTCCLGNPFWGSLCRAARPNPSIPFCVMPSWLKAVLSVDDDGDKEFAFLDSGPPSGDAYRTLVFVHGHTYHSSKYFVSFFGYFSPPSINQMCSPVCSLSQRTTTCVSSPSTDETTSDLPPLADRTR